jgi:hypothetical protein
MPALHSPCAGFAGTGAPVHEIEITSEMSEAGMLAYVSHDEDFESREEIVAHIFRAMLAAATTSKAPDRAVEGT